jgi:hypothetical protein
METHGLIVLAREKAEEIVDLAGELLRSGADLARTHRGYVITALDQLAEAEAQALLASASDHRALEALESLVLALDRLPRKAYEEHERQLKAD